MDRKTTKSIVRQQLKESFMDDIMNDVSSLKKKISSIDIDDVKRNIQHAKKGFTDFLNKIRSGEYSLNGKDADSAVAKSISTKMAGKTLTQDDAFMARVKDVASNLGVEPNDLLKVMWKESGLNPARQNSYTEATGLIQFMPSTAEKLGTSVDELKEMPAVEQMDYVEKYFEPYRGIVHNYEDLYMVTFFPAAVGKPDDYVLRTKRASAQLLSRQNPAIAKAAGKTPGEPLTVADLRQWINSK